MNDAKFILKRNGLIVVISLILQGFWEYFVCGLFYDVKSIKNMTSLMFEATLGDVMITVVIFNFLLLINRSKNHTFDLKDNVIVCLYGFSAAMFFETKALEINRWAYSDAMNNFMGTGIGVMPILQLILLLPLTFIIENVIIRINNKRIGGLK